MKFSKKKLLLVLGTILFVVAIYFSPIVKGILVDRSPALTAKYESQLQDYNFNYPSDWFLEDAAEKDGVITVSNYDPSFVSSLPIPDPKKFAIDVVVFKDSHTSSNLNGFLNWYDQNNYEGTGSRTIVYETKPVMINGNDGVERRISSPNGPVLEIFLKNERRIYLLTTRDDPDFNKIFNSIAQSFLIKDL